MMNTLKNFNLNKTNYLNKVDLYVDSMLIEVIVEDCFTKKASVGDTVSSLIDKVKNYFESKTGPNSEAEDTLDLISPIGINILFRALGLKWIGILLSLAQQVFKINVAGFLSSAYEKIKELIINKKPINEQIIDSSIDNAINENYEPISSDDKGVLESAKKYLTSSSLNKQLIDARFIKMALVSYEEGKFNEFIKVSEEKGEKLPSLQIKIKEFLKKIISWIFKIALTSAGVIVAGKIIRTLVTENEPVKYQISQQKVFKLNPSYQDKKYNLGDVTWAEGFTNNTSGISDMLVKFSKEVYLGLDGLESLIKSLPSFQEVVDSIENFNLTSAGSRIVFLPKMFNTKRQIVDLFIDDLANKTSK